MRKRPSVATAIALLALFVSLSGTAAAAVVITSNSQVAAHVISGAAGPSSDKKNLISGSIGPTDLHPGAVGTTQLAAGAVTRAKLNLPGVALTSKDTDPNNTSPRHVATLPDGVTVGFSCVDDGSGGVRQDLFFNGPTGQIRGYWIGGTGGSFPTPVLISPITTPDPNAASVDIDVSDRTYTELELTYHNAKHVVTLNLDAGVDAPNKTCDMYGTAVAAPN
jgi:hypothetical protein